MFCCHLISHHSAPWDASWKPYTGRRIIRAQGTCPGALTISASPQETLVLFGGGRWPLPPRRKMVGRYFPDSISSLWYHLSNQVWPWLGGPWGGFSSTGKEMAAITMNLFFSFSWGVQQYGWHTHRPSSPHSSCSHACFISFNPSWHIISTKLTAVKIEKPDITFFFFFFPSPYKSDQ